MKCPKCKAEVPTGNSFCDNCGNPIGSNPYGSKGDTGLDKSTNIYNIGTVAGPGILKCPICRRNKKLEEFFECEQCGRQICVTHQDPETYLCTECMGLGATAGSTESLFQINFTFTNPYVPLKQDCLVQTAVSFTSHEDAAQVMKLKTHLYMVLDVSGSMNREDKYPLLRQAIPELIQQMDNGDYLTIILFSNADDLVISKSIGQIRGQIPALLKRIDSSGVIFGRSTLLASALRTAIEEIKHFRKENPHFINRLYILTDGQLHDAEDCVRLNGQLRSLESEVASYGFGEDFELDALNRLMEGVPGNTVKHIFNTEDVKQTFSHIGDLAQRIVAKDAEFEFVFASEVIAGDAFRYQPGTEYYGSVDPHSKTFRTKLGALERERMYTFCFEGRLLQKGAHENQLIGTARLKFRAGGTPRVVSAAISINRTDENWRLSRISEETQQLFQVLDAMRNTDPDVLLKSLRARLAIYNREGADPELVKVVVGAIAKLEAGYSLTEDDNRDLEADTCTHTGD